MTPNLVQRIHHENLWLRKLLEKVAEDLEHLVCDTIDQGSDFRLPEAHRKLLEARAIGIRQQLWEGQPAEWQPR